MMEAVYTFFLIYWAQLAKTCLIYILNTLGQANPLWEYINRSQKHECRPHSFISGNICFKFSAFYLCSVDSCSATMQMLQILLTFSFYCCANITLLMGSSSVVHSEENMEIQLEWGAHRPSIYHRCQRHLCCFDWVVYVYNQCFMLPIYSKDIVERSFLLNVTMCPRHSCHVD